MATQHPDTDIIAYVRGELDASERARVGAHLGACPECRAHADGVREILDDLAATAPAPPPLDWRQYRAEIRSKIAARSPRGRAPRSWWQPVPLAASLALASVLGFLAVGNLHRGKPADLAAVEETVFGHRLDVVQQQPLLERLDLFEDLEVIRNLGPLAARQEG